jgi:copper homeostasis protein
MRVEISVESADSVRVAARASAARVELCAGLSDGGLTPSAALIEAAAELAEVHVLVRPRPGDFHYSRDDVDLVVRDIAVARRRGAAGVVVGALAGDGTVADDCARFVDAALVVAPKPDTSDNEMQMRSRPFFRFSLAVTISTIRGAALES